MKSYTFDELRQARKASPIPLQHFMLSPTLTTIYSGIEKKHALNDTQMYFVLRIVGATMLGLESETALETNIHQALPELSHTATVELVADITTRILKEAKRRVVENILEPSELTEALDAAATDPEYRKLENLDEDTPEWRGTVGETIAKEEAERLAFEEKVRTMPTPTIVVEPEDVDLSDVIGDTPVKSRLELEQEAIDKEFEERLAAFDIEKTGTPVRQGGIPKTPEQPSKIPALENEQLAGKLPPATAQSFETKEPLAITPKVPLATQKLSAPTVQQSSSSQVESVLGRGISSVELTGASNTQTQKEARPPRPLEKIDPYRESVE